MWVAYLRIVGRLVGATLLTLGILIGSGLAAHADVAEIELKELVVRSDVIVVVDVTGVETAAATEKPADPRMGPVMIATARVLETWKGTERKEVHLWHRRRDTAIWQVPRKGKNWSSFSRKTLVRPS